AVADLAHLLGPFLDGLVDKDVVHVNEVVKHGRFLLGAGGALAAHRGEFVERRGLRAPIFFPDLRWVRHVQPGVLLCVLADLGPRLVWFGAGRLRWARAVLAFPLYPEREDVADR